MSQKSKKKIERRDVASPFELPTAGGEWRGNRVVGGLFLSEAEVRRHVPAGAEAVRAAHLLVHASIGLLIFKLEVGLHDLLRLLVHGCKSGENGRL
jgi:hypothetical protein